MICEACGKKPATVHITDNPYDKKKKREIHLCDDCAREKDQIVAPSLRLMLSGPTGRQISEEVLFQYFIAYGRLP